MLIPSIFQYDSNVFLAGIISLLLVILFVLLLHIYAKWFLTHTRRRRSRNPVPILRPPRYRHVSFDTDFFSYPCRGLEASVIASLPLFVYEPDDTKAELDCVICLSVFEEREAGRRLPKCGHGFHVECIDMWLKSHSNCPICRAPVEIGLDSKEMNTVSDQREELEIVVEALSSGENESRVREMGELLSISPASSSLSSQVVAFGDSFKRMLSRNRSEHKVHPSAASDVQVMSVERERELVAYSNTYS